LQQRPPPVQKNSSPEEPEPVFAEAVAEVRPGRSGSTNGGNNMAEAIVRPRAPIRPAAPRH